MSGLVAGRVVGAWTIERVFGLGVEAIANARDDGGTEVVLHTGPTRAWQDRMVAALQSIDHPSVPKLVDAGAIDGAWYVAVRPHAVETLAERMFAGPVPLPLVCTWLRAVADALRTVHAAGWVHGDVSPDHIHVADDGRAWLVGFGAAGRLDESRAGAQPRGLAHLAPEVLEDPAAAMPRADLYAFGTVAYELLSGEPAFPAAAWAGQVDQRDFLLTWKTRHRELDPGDAYPDWLRALVKKCTDRDPKQRLPDFDSVVSWLDASRPSWSLRPIETPKPVQRAELPPLRVQPTQFDAEQIARAIAEQLTPEPRLDLYVLVAGSAGVAAGLGVAVLIILYVELGALA